ncbi:AAA family ATPase [Mammaliicoccus sp. H-M34]|uniref:AAA family ATPase n=1 Tax=Mammaliicoccus sp. H-M34 TaxID=2898693 RepID=UPI001EFB7298|nr:AAA family ATPase [Mammaliicoccus sp. H-M34]
MISEIILPQDRFLDVRLTNLKRKNFIYGKNGTGKSSITHEILKQYSESHTVLVFQGFQSVIAENGKLNAISLGDKNSELQPQIDSQNELVKKLYEDLTYLNETNDNTLAKLKKSKEKSRELERKVENFYKKAASRIKNEHSEWTGIKYDKNDFEKDINFSNSLSDKEIIELKKNEKQTTMDNIKRTYINDVKAGDFLDSVNHIITVNITESAVLNFQSKEKRNWVKEGLYLHKEGELCAFCGSKVNKRRLEELNSYFNDEMKGLEKKIDDEVLKINNKKIEVENIKKIDSNNFYPNFHSEIDKLNLEIMDIKDNYTKYYELMLQALKEKKENIFLPLKKLIIDTPSDFSGIIQKNNDLFAKNLHFNDNLEEIKKEAQRKLKLNEVSRELNENDYFEMKKKLDELQNHEKEMQQNFDNQQNKLSNEEQKLKELISKTVDESKAAENINKFLINLGNQSFTLINVKEGEQKGQYNIKGHDNVPRDIETLSTGEKNIVAFLWFISKLEDNDIETKDNTIIIFDDPMNSNDDTVQYLIITELQKLLRNIGKRQVFILTHNVHFYLNTRYQWWNGSSKSNYDKTTYHLIKNGVKTQVSRIDNKDDDLKTSYDSLWSEVKWLNSYKKPDMMLNPLRRIFETYQKFNKIEDMFYNDTEASKLFNVNSHSIDDFEADLNGKNEVELMNKVKRIFYDLGAEEHFNHYWK